MSDRRNQPVIARLYPDWDHAVAHYRAEQAIGRARQRLNRVLWALIYLYVDVFAGLIGWALGLMLRAYLDGLLDQVAAITHLVGG